MKVLANFAEIRKMTLRKLVKALLPYGFVVLLLPSIRRYINNRTPKKALAVAINLADNCNLNCKGCLTFSTLVENPNYLDNEIFKRDMKRLGELCNKNISGMNLTGGEPLLNPNISEICNISREHSTGRIEIRTNGLLLDSQPADFWEACRKNNIEIAVSSYPIKVNRSKINEIAKFHAVKVFYLERDKTNQWSKFVLDIDGKQDYKKSFYNCPHRCNLLHNGNIGVCAMVFTIERFNNYFKKNLIVDKNDYINIYKAQSIDEILKFLSKPIKLCRYCNIQKSNYYKDEWGISKHLIEEWT